MSTLNSLPIHRDAPVGAHDGAGRAARARLAVGLFHVAVATSVHSFVGERDDVQRAGHDAEAASLAPLRVHHDRPFHFSHVYLFFVMSFSRDVVMLLYRDTEIS